MLVQIRGEGRTMVVPLSQLTAIDPDEQTREAIKDWHYWVAQDQLFGRWQRIPNKVNTLAHLFKVSNMSSFPPPACTESAEEPI
jgi:hypothetical protein